MKQDKPVMQSTLAGADEIAAYERLALLQKICPIPQNEMIANLGLFHVRASFGRIQFFYELYRKILNTHGVIMEFGVRWGQTLALFSTFRAMHEPYNMSRKIIGFDTFEGFPSVSASDGRTAGTQVGAYSVTPGYADYLDELLTTHEQLAPRSHVKKHELVKGDVVQTLPEYLKQHPETIIALAYFDMDLYEPTRKCLELIKPHLAKNSIVGFDELVLESFPGETQALKEVWGVSNFQIVRDPMSPLQSYLVFT